MFRFPNSKFIFYLCNGSVGALLEFLSFFFLIFKLNIDPMFSHVFSYLFGCWYALLINLFFVFKKFTIINLIKYIVVILFATVINSFLFKIGLLLSLDTLFLKISVIFLMVLIQFKILKKIL